MYDKLAIAKVIIRWTTVAGTAKIVKEVIANNIDEPETLVQKAKILAGTFAVGGLISSIVGDYTDDKVDEVVDQVKEFFNKDEPTE